MGSNYSKRDFRRGDEETKEGDIKNGVTSQQHDPRMSLSMLGNSGAGKSCIVMQYVHGKFTPYQPVTQGVESAFKAVELKDNEGHSRTVRINIWDTAGQERFRCITSMYYRGANGIVLVYDVTNEQSFHDIEYWLGEIHQNASPNVFVVLVGNKSDLSNERKISKERGEALARQNNIPFFETSARHGLGINEVFEWLINEIWNRMKEIELQLLEEQLKLLKPFPATKEKGSWYSSCVIS